MQQLQGVSIEDFERVGRMNGFKDFEQLRSSSPERATVSFVAVRFICFGLFSSRREDGRFESLSLLSIFDDIQSVEKINEWNGAMRFVKGNIRDERAYFQMDVVLKETTEANLSENFDIWVSILFEIAGFNWE